MFMDFGCERQRSDMGGERLGTSSPSIILATMSFPSTALVLGTYSCVSCVERIAAKVSGHSGPPVVQQRRSSMLTAKKSNIYISLSVTCLTVTD